MPATRIDLNDTIILNAYPDRYQVTGWDYDPANPQVSKLKFDVVWQGQSGSGTTINSGDIIVLNAYPDEYKVVGWDYSAQNPQVNAIIFDVVHQGP